MLLLSALVLAASAQGSGAQPAQNEALLLGKYTIMGEEVQAVLPSATGTIPPNSLSITHNGWNYWLDENGRFWERYKADGGWSEVKLLFDEAKAVQPKAPWRTKVVVFTRADVAEKGTDGVVRLRRFVLQRRQTQAIHQSLARFASMAEAYSGGNIRIELDVEHEQDWMSFTEGQGPGPFGLAFARQYFSPRINSGDYKAEDGVFRGPYQSVLYVFPLAEPSEIPGAWVNGSPVCGVSLAYSSDVSWALFSAWERQVAMRAQAKGYSLQPMMGRTDVASSVTPTMWKNVADPAPPAQDAYLARMKPAEGVKDWNSIADDPLAALPRLGRHNLESVTGGEIKWQDLEQEVFSALSGAYARGNYLFVLSWAADLFGTGIDPAYQPKAIGTVDLLNHTYIVFKLASPADHPLNLLKLQGLGVKVRQDGERVVLRSEDGTIEKVSTLDGKLLETTGGIPLSSAPNVAKVTATVSGVRVERPVVLASRNVPKPTIVLADDAVIAGSPEAAAGVGGLRTSVQVDPERGQVLQVIEDDLFRNGRVTLLGAVGKSALFAPMTHPYLEMWVKAKNPEPMQITVHGDNWKPVRVLLFGVLPGESAKVLGIEQSGSWQRVVIDLRQVPEVPERVTAITLDVPDSAKRWERRTFSPTVWVDDVRVVKQIDGAATPLIDPPAKKADNTSIDPEERALFAATATSAQAEALIVLLKDRDDMVAVNAAIAFQRMQEPKAVPVLSDLARSSVRRLSEAALLALAFQNTESAWTAVRQALNDHSEHVREVAVELLATRKDPMLAGPFSLLYSARSWHTRAAAARAIGSLPGEEAQAILLAFSNEIDPAVRVDFINSANPAHPDIENRLLWIVVNDPSDHVRAAAAIRMIYSGSEKLRTEGYKALGDESRTTRSMILNHLAAHPREEALSRIIPALADRQAEVRSAALRALAAVPGTVTVEMLSPILAEKDPSVQRQLIALAKTKRLKLPQEALDVLRSSVDPQVVQLAKEL